MNKYKLINLALGSVAAIAIYVFPIAGLSEPAHRCLGIFIWAIWMWISESLPLYITALSILFLEAVFLSPSLELPIDTFFAPFFSSVIALFMGGLVLADALQRHKADEFLAQQVLSRVGNKPSNILLGVIATTAVISLWISNTATTAMMMAVALSIARNVNSEDPFRKALILAVPFASCIGGLGTPVGTPPNLIAMQYLGRAGIEVSFIKWIILAFPIVIILVFVLWRLLIYYFPSPLSYMSLPAISKENLNSKQITVLVVFACTLLLWMTESLHHLKSGVVGLLPIIVIYGGNLLNRADFRKVEWDILFLLGGGLTLGAALDKSGLSTWFVSQLDMQGIPVYILLLIVAVITIMLSTFVSHTSAANILIPMSINLRPEAAGMVCFIVGLSVSFGLALPISSPSNAIAYGTGEVKLGDMVKTGLIMGLAGLVLFATIGYFWWRFLNI
jgi:sodium-dependent dicarboxylate transporter 2/3/5